MEEIIRICKDCKIEKTISSFPKNGSDYRYSCKECHNQNNALKRELKKELIKNGIELNIPKKVNPPDFNLPLEDQIRICNVCNIEKPLISFPKNGETIRITCQDCRNKASSISYKKKIEHEKEKLKNEQLTIQNKILIQEETRVCTICNIEKKLTECYKKDNGSYRKICQDCFNERRRETRDLSKEKEYYEKNKTEILFIKNKVGQSPTKKQKEFSKKISKNDQIFLENSFEELSENSPPILKSSFEKQDEQIFQSFLKKEETIPKKSIFLPIFETYVEKKEKIDEKKESIINNESFSSLKIETINDNILYEKNIESYLNILENEPKRVCKKCNVEKDLKTCFKKEDFGYRLTCKSCQKEMTDEKDKIPEGNIEETKICNVCNIEKILSIGFKKDNGFYRKTCTDCFNKRRRELKEQSIIPENIIEKEKVIFKKSSFEMDLINKEYEKLLLEISKRPRKVCKKCNIEKDLDLSFKKCGDGKYYEGICNYCKTVRAIIPSKEELQKKEDEKDKQFKLEKIIEFKLKYEIELNSEETIYHIERTRKDIRNEKLNKQKSEKTLENNDIKEKYMKEKFYYALKKRIFDYLPYDSTYFNSLMGINSDEKLVYIWFEYFFNDEQNWFNYAENWQIDHVIPIKFFDLKDENQLKFAFHWSNVQPLKIKLNSKKYTKISIQTINSHLKKLYTFLSTNPEYQTKCESTWWPRLKLGYGYNFKDEKELKEFFQNGQSASNPLNESENSSSNVHLFLHENENQMNSENEYDSYEEGSTTK